MKKKIAITLDPKVLKNIDMRRASLDMKRSQFINYKLKRMLKETI